MPLFYTHTINEKTRLAIWHITETEDFFRKTISLQNDITHPHKRLQHLAGRYLLTILEPAFPLHLLMINPSKKPHLPEGPFHFSISHCGDFAAAIISETDVVGIDVELITDKLRLIRHKFLSASENELLERTDPAKNDLTLLTSMWSAKEAMYKWYGKGSVDFRKNMIIQTINYHGDEGIMKTSFEKETNTKLVVHFRFFDEMCLAWCAEGG